MTCLCASHVSLQADGHFYSLSDEFLHNFQHHQLSLSAFCYQGAAAGRNFDKKLSLLNFFESWQSQEQKTRIFCFREKNKYSQNFECDGKIVKSHHNVDFSNSSKIFLPFTMPKKGRGRGLRRITKHSQYL